MDTTKRHTTTQLTTNAARELNLAQAKLLELNDGLPLNKSETIQVLCRLLAHLNEDVTKTTIRVVLKERVDLRTKKHRPAGKAHPIASGE